MIEYDACLRVRGRSGDLRIYAKSHKKRPAAWLYGIMNFRIFSLAEPGAHGDARTEWARRNAGHGQDRRI